jgi:protein required for attachment to host cells
MHKPRTWALAANACHPRVVQARVVQGLDAVGETGPVPPELTLSAEVAKPGKVMADRRGRSFSLMGDGRRSGMEYAADAAHDDMRAFAAEIARLLDAHRAKGDLARLAVVAAPEMRGLLRDAMTPDLRAAVMLEQDRNLLHDTPKDLRRTMREAVSPF